jgi:hypothetical protein
MLSDLLNGHTETDIDGSRYLLSDFVDFRSETKVSGLGAHLSSLY